MKAKLVTTLLAVAIVIGLSGTVFSQPMKRQFSKSIQLKNGTTASITIIADQSQEETVIAKINQLLTQAAGIDQEINADIKTINKLTSKQKAKIDKFTFDLISKSKNLAALTNGWFDIVSTQDKGFFVPKDYRKLKLNKKEHTFAFKGKNMKLKVNNIWSAYLTDYLLQRIVKAGYKNAKVEVGTTSRNVGKDIHRPWTVSIRLQQAQEKSKYAHRTTAYSFTNKAVAEITPASFTKPLIDPKSKKQVGANFRNVTVFAHDAMTAQALALALYTIGEKGAVPFIEKHPEIKVISVSNKGEFITSKGLKINAYDHSKNDLAAAKTKDQGPKNHKLRKKELE